MPCHASNERLSAYLDDAGHLVAERAGLETHLADCAQCANRLDALRALKHAVARLPSREEPTGAVRTHVEALRLEQPPRERRRRVFGLAAAAALAVTVAASYAIRRVDHAAGLADDLVADHLSSVPEVRPAEIASNDRASIAQFFGDHVPFPVVVPDVPGADLLGARLCRIEGRRVELLFYRREGRTLSLFVTDNPVAGGACWAARGHHVCSRVQGKTAMLLVGELPADELRRLLDESTL